MAPHIDGNVGIIHIDRHIDIQEKDMDERMHRRPGPGRTHEGTVTTHRDDSHMHDVGLPNCHPKNLVQVGIGGWYGNLPGPAVAKRRGTSVLTMQDIEKHGAKKAQDRPRHGLGRSARRSTCLSTSTRSIPASRLGRDRRNPADSCRERPCR